MERTNPHQKGKLIAPLICTPKTYPLKGWNQKAVEKATGRRLKPLQLQGGLFATAENPAPRKQKTAEEFALQCDCIELFDMLYPEYAQLLFHVPNFFVMRDHAEGARIGAMLNRMGRRRGIWDCQLAVPNGAIWGVWIEFKIGSSLTDEQLIFREHLLQLNCKYLFETFKRKNDFGYFLKEYLGPSKRINYNFEKPR